MSQPPIQPGGSGVWLLIAGLLAGAALLALMAWDSSPGRGRRGSPDVVEITPATWQRDVVESNIPVLVEFTASWCPPCRALAPTIDNLAEKYKGKVRVAKIDFDRAEDLRSKYGVDQIPRVFLFNGGDRPVKSFLGRQPEEAYASEIDAILARNSGR